MSALVNSEKALIFRIVHRDNLPWIVENGLHCRKSTTVDPNFRRIGNHDLIEKRETRPVPIDPGGTLGDYVPFYFTPHSPMLYNVITGYNDITQRSNDEIVILVSSLQTLVDLDRQFVFTDRHAYLNYANFYSDLTDLDKLDWESLQARDFRRDPEDPGKFERYQAEALVYRHLPHDSLLGVACHSDAVKTELEEQITLGGQPPIKVRSDWYF